MAVEAVYMGQKDNKYWVNVKNANPTGKIGDGGVCRPFSSEEAAKAYAASVNEKGVDTFVSQDSSKELPLQRHQGDVFKRA